MNIELQYRYLDAILLVLFEAQLHSLGFNEICEEVLKRIPKEVQNKKKKQRNMSIEIQPNYLEISNSIQILVDEELILEKEKNYYNLTYKGVGRIANPFLKEYENINKPGELVIHKDKKSQEQDNKSLLITVLAIIVALFVGLPNWIKLFKKDSNTNTYSELHKRELDSIKKQKYSPNLNIDSSHIQNQPIQDSLGKKDLKSKGK